MKIRDWFNWYQYYMLAAGYHWGNSRRQQGNPGEILQRNKGVILWGGDKTSCPDEEPLHQCTQLGKLDSMPRKGILLLYSTLVKLHLQYCVQMWSPQYRRDMDLLEPKIIWVVENFPYEHSQRELETFNLEKRRLQRNLRTAFWYLKRGYKKEQTLEGLLW